MLLSAESITKTYGTRVLLDRVSFYLEPGERVGVIGVNGAGKSVPVNRAPSFGNA